MRRIVSSLLLVLCCVACNGTQKKHENPVLLQAPRRVSHIEPEAGAQIADAAASQTAAAKDDQIKMASALSADPWGDWQDDTAIFNSKVAATVNGAPILNGDVIDRYSGVVANILPQKPYNKYFITTEFSYKEFYNRNTFILQLVAIG